MPASCCPRGPLELDVGGGLAAGGRRRWPGGADLGHGCDCGTARGRSGARGLPIDSPPMCGIVGIRGCQAGRAGGHRGAQAAGVPRLRLRRDRAGRRRDVVSDKRAGKLANLEKAIAEHPLPRVTTGIGHTRWATHGAPTDRNAHPHLGRTRRVALVHNGIIENFAELRAALEAEGVEMASDTDTEVAAHLLEEQLETGVDLTVAMQNVCRGLEGAFTLVAVDAQDPDRVVAARRNSPLVVGIGEGENFLGSDVAAFIEHTREAMELDQDQVVTITREGVSVSGFDGTPGRGSPLPRRLGPLRRREGRPRLVHAQGDLRAAARRRRLAARAPRRRRAAAARRDAAVRPGPARHRQDHHHRGAARRSTPAWSPSTPSSTGAGSRSRSSSPASSATATRSSPAPRWSSRSASPARPPTPCRRSATRASSARRCWRSATPTARPSRASPTA